MNAAGTATEGKREVGDLALFGGTPAFEAPLHVGRPNVGDRDTFFTRLSGVLDRGILSNGGPLVHELEERVAAMLGVRHALAVNNATIGLQIAARAADLHGEVIVPSFTFIATAHALDWIGLEPVFGDIEPARLGLDAGAIERLIGPRTSAILATHLWGRTADVEALAAIARRHGLRLLFDAAHAFGCSRDGRMVGGFGDAEVFSFHATKFVNAFEGGLVTTNDDELAERVRRMRNFGFHGYDRTDHGGTNGKMHEASAAMALTSLDAMDRFVAVNRRNLERYLSLLDGLPGIRAMGPDERGTCNAQHVVLRVSPGASALGRDELQALLVAEHVLARRYFYPGCHRMAPYDERPVRAPLPVTEAVADEVLVLPTGTSVGPEDIAMVCDLIRFGLEHAEEIRERRLVGSAT